MFQIPTINNSGICRDPVVINPSLDRTNFSLPEKYSNVPAATTKINDLVIPEARLAEIKVMWKELKMKNLGGLSMLYRINLQTEEGASSSRPIKTNQLPHHHSL